MAGHLYLRKKIEIFFLFIPFAIFFSCGDLASGNTVLYIAFGGTPKDTTELALTVNNSLIYRKLLSPDKHVYKHVLYKTSLTKNVVKYKFGEADTSFIYIPMHKKNYISIIYSKWQKKFIVIESDSSTYWGNGIGNNDEVIYK